MEVGLAQGHVPGLDPAHLADITTADAVARGRTVLAHVHALTVAVHHLDGTSPHPSSPTSSPRPATTATVTPSPAVATATAEVPATRGSARAPDPDPAHQSKQTGSGKERESGSGKETAAPTTCPQRNTSTSEGRAIEETGGRGRGLGPMTGRERGSGATRANTTAAAADTQDTAAIGAETPTQLQTRPGLTVSEGGSLYSATVSWCQITHQDSFTPPNICPLLDTALTRPSLCLD